jgi:hypothetical protein
MLHWTNSKQCVAHIYVMQTFGRNDPLARNNGDIDNLGNRCEPAQREQNLVMTISQTKT